MNYVDYIFIFIILILGKEFLSCRNVLWIMVFFGFAINYMLRINLNMAIVAMIIPRTKAAAVAQCSGPHIITQGSWKNITNNTLFSTQSMSSINNNPMVIIYIIQ